jgi:ankyrin repeat protein
VAEALLAAGADPNGRIAGATPLIAAADSGDADLVRLLLDAGAEPGATFDGSVLMVRWRYPYKETGWTALHLAACRNHVAAVRALVDAGAPLEVEASRGITPLRCAVMQGHEDRHRDAGAAVAPFGEEERLAGRMTTEQRIAVGMRPEPERTRYRVDRPLTAAEQTRAKIAGAMRP